MDEAYQYLKIAESIRKDIANGTFKEGDTLPSIRHYSEGWNCTIGTVQRAIGKLASEGIVASHVGKGTTVIKQLPQHPVDSIRRANLILQSEEFLMEVLTSGNTVAEVEDAFRIALNRWKSVSQFQDVSTSTSLRFSGSHDLAVAWMATHFDEINPGLRLHVNFSGSLAGLIALAENRADIAGTHLWDSETVMYNIPYIQRLFPGEKLALITMANRRIGWLVKSGNPKSFEKINDLTRPDICYVNRCAGSGTRVLLDSLLRENNIHSASIKGYANPKNNHLEVAAEIAEGRSDVGLGLEAAGIPYGLDFIFLTLERYDLVVKESFYFHETTQKVIEWLKSEPFHQLLNRLGGYDFNESGMVRWS